MDISRIVLNPATQLREKISEERVKEYAEAMAEGALFPAVVVFGTDEQAILADGWHRVEAALLVGRTEINADVRPGTLEDAIWYALGANAHHGLSYSTAEKQQNVKTALRIRTHESDRAIGRQCGVHNMTVAKYRRELEATDEIIQLDRRLGRDNVERPATQPPRPKAEKSDPQPTFPPVDDDDEEEDGDEVPPVVSRREEITPTPPDGGAPTLGQMLKTGQLTLEPMPEQSPGTKAYYVLISVFAMVGHDPESVAEGATQPAADEPGWQQFDAWYEKFRTAYRRRLDRPMRIVGGH